MTKQAKNRTVLREYQGLYDTEELLRRIIRHHIRDAYEKNAMPGEGPDKGVGRYGDYGKNGGQ